jgi:hypothetical protein
MGFFDWVKGVGQKIGHAVSVGAKAVGHAVAVGAKAVGKTALKGLDYTIQGLKIASDAIDKVPVLGTAVSFIPYYGAVKAGIDIADEIRKGIKGEQKFDWNMAGRLALDAGIGALSAVGGASEVRAYKAGVKAFKGARNIGEGIGQATKEGVKGIVSESPLLRVGLRAGKKIGTKAISTGAKAVRAVRGVEKASTEAYNVPNPSGKLADLIT